MLELDVIGEAAMVQLGARVGEALANEQQALVFLEGNLGAGKTTLCRGVLGALGHRGAVKSPTYTLVEPYELASCKLYHFDLYRMADPEELEFMGIRDYLNSDGTDTGAKSGNYCVVEWPNCGAGVLPEPDVAVTITVAGKGRRVRLESCTAIGDNLLQALKI